jgi:hypothetical protein
MLLLLSLHLQQLHSMLQLGRTASPLSYVPHLINGCCGIRPSGKGIVRRQVQENKWGGEGVPGNSPKFRRRLTVLTLFLCCDDSSQQVVAHIVAKS